MFEYGSYPNPKHKRGILFAVPRLRVGL